MILQHHSRHLFRALSCPQRYTRCVVSSLTSSKPPPSNQTPVIEFSWPFPDFRKSQKFWELKSRVLCFLVGISGKTFLSKFQNCYNLYYRKCTIHDKSALSLLYSFAAVFNRTKIHNREILIDAIFKRPAGVPLITVSNHESCIDDPGLIGNRNLLRSYIFINRSS